MAKAIYKFNLDQDRMGSLSGVFVAETEDIEALIESSILVCFGEVLGKHSDVEAEMGAKNFKMVSQDPEFVRLFEQHDLSVGHNPLDANPSGNDEDEPWYVGWSEGDESLPQMLNCVRKWRELNGK